MSSSVSVAVPPVTSACTASAGSLGDGRTQNVIDLFKEQCRRGFKHRSSRCSAFFAFPSVVGNLSAAVTVERVFYCMAAAERIGDSQEACWLSANIRQWVTLFRPRYGPIRGPDIVDGWPRR